MTKIILATLLAVSANATSLVERGSTMQVRTTEGDSIKSLFRRAGIKLGLENTEHFLAVNPKVAAHPQKWLLSDTEYVVPDIFKEQFTQAFGSAGSAVVPVPFVAPQDGPTFSYVYTEATGAMIVLVGARVHFYVLVSCCGEDTNELRELRKSFLEWNPGVMSAAGFLEKGQSYPIPPVFHQEILRREKHIARITAPHAILASGSDQAPKASFVVYPTNDTIEVQPNQDIEPAGLFAYFGLANTKTNYLRLASVNLFKPLRILRKNVRYTMPNSFHRKIGDTVTAAMSSARESADITVDVDTNCAPISDEAPLVCQPELPTHSFNRTEAPLAP